MPPLGRCLVLALLGDLSLPPLPCLRGASCFSTSATTYSRVPAGSAEMWRPRARCFFGKATSKGASLAECLHSRVFFPAARLVGVMLPQGFLEECVPFRIHKIEGISNTLVNPLQSL